MEITAMRVSIRILAFSLVVLSSTAFAHRPTMSDGAASDADHAIEFQDVQISRVVYHEVTEQAPRVWITFEIDQPQTLFLQIGVPVLDRLRDYRPALALIGPGLPDLRLPFESPGGLGGVVIDTRDIERPRDFYEPFTKTRSWILREKDVLLPEAGRYYVVAYEPDEQPGKLWAATGRKEVWNSSDILNMSKIMTQVRRFHEVAKVSDATVKPVEQRVLFGFDGRDSNNEWTSVNDDVMGGVSEGSVLEFKGVVSLENNGGFASIRSRPDTHDLSDCGGLLLRVRGDGHRYACNIRTDFPIAAGSYRQSFETNKNEWQEIALPFRDFVAASFGRVMRDAPDLNIGRIRSFGFTISDKQAGPFKLEVDWIKAIKMPSESIVDTDSAKAGCATCIFHMKGVEGCKLAVEIDGRHYLVEGSDIDDHGDAHAADGLCNTARSVKVKGKISGGRFVAEEFRVLP
ncbi:MAG: CIA30 family protein [Planctomycetota bacterium]|jgi:monofunctional biosynthetic peptidoglycan transglycosylase